MSVCSDVFKGSKKGSLLLSIYIYFLDCWVVDKVFIDII